MPSFDPSDFVEFIEHKGKKVLYVDYSSCHEVGHQIILLRYVADIYRNSPSPLLRLSNFRKVKGNSHFMEEAKKLSKEIMDQKTQKGAVLGITGLKKILLQGYNLVGNTKLRPFETKEEALDFLTEE